MDALARREHSRAELTDKLLGAGFDSDTAAITLEALVADGLQCDQRFVESYIRSYARRGKGPVRISYELGRRGVDESLVGRAMVESTIDWRKNARRVRITKFGSGVPEEFAARAKQMRFLQYRGFTNEQISASFDASGD